MGDSGNGKVSIKNRFSLTVGNEDSRQGPHYNTHAVKMQSVSHQKRFFLFKLCLRRN